MNAFLIAAPGSGSGKTLITLGLLRALKQDGLQVGSAKAGPDYIDPAFHAAATSVPSINLDPWAMRGELIRSLFLELTASHDLTIVEGMMGLFDGAADGSGSGADLASLLGLPVVMVVDASRMSFSVSALVKGYRDHRPEIDFAGVILNKVGSPRHEVMLRSALDVEQIPVLGAVPANSSLELPSRHLGLVQASEHQKLEEFISVAVAHVGQHCDLDALAKLECATANAIACNPVRPLGQHIAVAHDEAFAFSYPHLLRGWRKRGAELSFFSPLADEVPSANADAIYLPGGYPELHAGKIASAQAFRSGLKLAASSGKTIYGECGGYMVLGEGLVDAEGNRHEMTDLLKLETTFEKRKLHLGYREIAAKGFVLGDRLRGHEFHYTSVVHEEGEPLFEVSDALGEPLGRAGIRKGSVMGSYMHIIDRVA